jgi:hypothetical protein
VCSEECKCEKLRQENTSPIHIPLYFLDGVRGLGKVDPKQLTPPPGTKAAEKQAASKKRVPWAKKG